MDTLYYEGFFARDPLLAHDTIVFRDGPANAAEVVGIRPLPMPMSLQRNDIVAGSLLLCFAMLLLIIKADKNRLHTRIKEFFYTDAKKNKPNADNTRGDGTKLFCLTALMALMLGLLFFCYAQSCYNIFVMPVSPIALLAIYVAAVLAILALKDMTRVFVHAVFFDKQERSVWRHNFALLMLMECTLLFPLTLVAVYFNITVEITAYALLVMLLFVKILLLFKAYTTFFVKSYGFIHLFMYFCALEVTPIAVLWSLLTRTTTFLEMM